MKRTSASTDPQVLFESAYGQIMAVQEGTGKVGFTRENHRFSFAYELPVDEWVELEFKNTMTETQLYVNGELVDTLGDGDKAAEGKALKATTMLPLARIGSKTQAFRGYVDDVRVSTDAEFASTMELDYAVLTAESVLAVQDVPGLRDLLDAAYDLFRDADPSAEPYPSWPLRFAASWRARTASPATRSHTAASTRTPSCRATRPPQRSQSSSPRSRSLACRPPGPRCARTCPRACSPRSTATRPPS